MELQGVPLYGGSSNAAAARQAANQVEVVAALKRLLAEAELGMVVGVAIVAELDDGDYRHVAKGSTVDDTEAAAGQLERLADKVRALDADECVNHEASGRAPTVTPLLTM